MRELKFRVWLDTKDYNKFDRCKMIYSGDITKDDISDFPFKIDKKKTIDIMQYIGIKDKYEKDIYEGDIIKRKTIKNDSLEIEEIGVVEYKNGQYILSILEGVYYEINLDAMFSSTVSNYEIVGNKYQTPALREYL